MKKLSDAVSEKLVRSCHDCSEGGIAVALSEMAFAGGLGVDASTENIPAEKGMTEDLILFSESNTRFIVEVPKEKIKSFEKAMKSTHFGLLGKFISGNSFVVKGEKKKALIKTTIDKLKNAWQRPFSKL